MRKVRFADILDGIDESWSYIEKAKYIYDEICRLSRYDERFIYSTNEDLLRDIYYKDVNIYEPIEPILICKTMNEIYSQLLSRLGIKNKCIEKPSNIKIGYSDVALIFYDENNNPYFTAIAGDIQRCKYGMKTQFFCGCDKNYPEASSSEVTLLSPQELRQIDEATGYVKRDRDYSDAVFDLISSEVKQNNEFLKLLAENPIIVRQYLSQQGIENVPDSELVSYVKKFTIDDILQIKMMVANYMKNPDPNYGYIETKKQSIAIIKSILNRSEQKRVDSFDMIRESKNNIEIISIIRMRLRASFLYYIHSQDTHEYELLSSEGVIKIANEYRSNSNKQLIGNLNEEI